MNSSVHVGCGARSAIAFGIVLGIGLLASPRAGSQRVAIRVDCSDPNACTLAEALALDIWSEHRGSGIPLDLVVERDTLQELDAAGVSWQMIDPDIDATAAAEADRINYAVRSADWFAEYHDYREIGAYLEGLAELAPDRAKLSVIGASIDGRAIWALRIGNGTGQRMLINGTMHAREWISPAVTTCIADRLVRNYDTDPRVREFVDSTDLWVVPVVNPDGYQHSWSTDRYWRKNRRDRHGVDLNRNFSVAWGTGSSTNKRSETYRGEYAFSEPESIALRDLAKRERIQLHLDFHSYSQLILHPWDWSPQPVPDHDKFRAVGDRMASAIYAQHGERYKLMAGVELYPAGGTVSDWMYGEAGAFSYTIELRPKGRGGFVLPPEQIRPTCDEAYASMIELRNSF